MLDVLALDATLIDVRGFNSDSSCDFVKPPYIDEADGRPKTYATFGILVSTNSGTQLSPSVRIGEEMPPSYIRTYPDSDVYDLFSQLGKKTEHLVRRVLDYNQDGKDDILLANGRINPSTFDFFSVKNSSLVKIGSEKFSLSFSQAASFDLPGNSQDTRLAILAFSPEGVKVAYNSSLNHDRIISIKNDLTESTITYSTLVDADVYAKGTGSIFPVVDVQYPMSVVKSISNPNGLGGSNLSRYRYGGLRSHFDYGSLGFQWMASMDDASGALNYSEYLQNFPLTGSLSRSQEQRCTGRAQLPWTGCEVLSQEISEWAVTESGSSAASKLYRPYIQKTQEHSWLKSSSAQ